MAREATISELTELDSDGSSCGERGDARKRLRFDGDSTGPKKRRKQTTPVRFPVVPRADMLLHDESNEDEDEDENSEGKLSTQSPLPRRSLLRGDENLNNEFRCQYCSQLFDDKESLHAHLDNEHGTATQLADRNRSDGSPSAAIKMEPPSQQPDQHENSVNLLSVKSFAANWLGAGPHAHTQMQMQIQMQMQMQTQMQMQMQMQMQTQNEELWSSPVTANQIPALPNHLQALSGFSGTLTQYLPMPAFPLTDSSHMTKPSMGQTPVRIFNPDAYCDLCNKEFCNKYFLKTHKANKHGIYVDSPGPSTAEGNVVGTLYPSNMTNSMVKLEAPATPPALSVACDLCQKRFKNEETMRKHRQKMHTELPDQSQEAQFGFPQNEEDGVTPRDSPSGVEALFKQEFGVEQEDASFVPAPRHLSPQSIQQARDAGFNADRLRRLGVINPEAFCEICCKEYCNKYFLRTHKMKRHGIVMQENEKSPGNPGAIATWHQVQTSPLNLIMAESAESNERSTDEYECKICEIRFQTAGLYQAHCRKMHESEEQRSPKQESDAEQTDQRNDTISEDLQKLQTMLLQLNGLKSGKGVSCGVCGKECENRATLHIHKVTEHGAIEEPTSPPQDKSPTTAVSGFCSLCGKDYPNQDALRRHIAEDHQPPITSSVPHTPTTTSTVTNSTPTSQTPTEKKAIPMTPTSSYCEICNKELCNKYFMKTHMQRMHGIEIENGAQIGGVICNICNKELCSKYFLRVHKHNTHGIVDENAASSTKQEAHGGAVSTEDVALKPEHIGDLSHRYFTHFTEVCPICNRRFRSIKWLKAHLMSDHGKTGVDKWREMEQQYQTTSRPGNRPPNAPKNAQGSNLKIPNGFDVPQQIKSVEYAGLGNQVLSNLLGSSSDGDQQLKSYRCSYCNFTTTVLPFLFLHERSHVNSHESAESEKSLQCPICSQCFHQSEMLHQHLLTAHQFPALLTHLQSPLRNNFGLDAERMAEAKEKYDPETKEDRTGNSPRVSANQTIPETVRNQRQEDTAVQVTPQGVYKCAQCGYATTNLNRIKKHVRKDHKAIGDPTDSVLAELSKTLKDVANRHKMPACYAMPQDMNSNPDKTIMQPFLIEEQEIMQAGEESSTSEKRFAPSLVYLPVKSRISNAVTASFTLSPA